jgi:hypothetical protein
MLSLGSSIGELALLFSAKLILCLTNVLNYA